MQAVDADFVARVVIGLVVITAPIDPVKLLFFNSIVDGSGQNRTTAAIRLTVYVTIILAIASLVGKELLEALGIDLNVFGAVGGIVIAGMGFEMLYGGGASKAQGEEQRQEGPGDGDGLLIPLAIPLIAGPGAITTTITFSSQNTTADGTLAMAAAIGIVAVITFLFYRFLGDALSRVKPTTIAILARLGGLILATLGFQMFLNGIKNFFE